MVYRLGEGSAEMVALLGSKGAHASEMARIGIPVPPGFTITTEVSRAYLRAGHRFPDGLWDAVLDNLRILERETGKRFGDVANPLVVSVRSGAPVSMPGMMDTVLNMGVTDATMRGLAALMRDERPALDAYRRFIQGFAGVVLGVERQHFEHLLAEAKRLRGLRFDYELPAAALRELIGQFKTLVRKETGKPLPQDPETLLRQAIEAVFSSWNNPRAIAYRQHQGIPDDLGTGCTVMVMVYGNLGEDSGTGVLFTRSPATGEKALYGEFLTNAQGEDVVAGVRTPVPIAELGKVMPGIYREVEVIARQLESHYKDVQDVEFTVERGKLHILQTRGAKRTAPAAVKIAVDLVREGVITAREAIGRVQPADVTRVMLPRFDEAAKERAVAQDRLLARGLGGSPGAASGQVVMDPEKAVAWTDAGKRVILVRAETSPDDVHGIIRALGVLTSRGGMTSHAAVVTRGLGKPCVVGTEELHVDMALRTATARGKTVKEGDVISIDGATGEVFLGEVPRVEPSARDLGDLNTLLGWADESRRLMVWANADTPEDAVRARANGAQGIGLCRTEHMFFAQDRLPHIQRLLSVGPQASGLLREVESLKAQQEHAPALERAPLQRRIAVAQAAVDQAKSVREYVTQLATLEEFQRADFYGILKTMHGLPVVIRLLDAPLHEFLPKHEDLLAEVGRLRASGKHPRKLAATERTLKLVGSLVESNPMLGHRGCRVGLTMPEIYEMQVRAIVRAASQLQREGIVVYPEIMIPIVSHVNELRWLRPRLDAEAGRAQLAAHATVHYKFGTMIEVPRAALTAAEIAKQAEFFSFGSNDLTQMTFAFSRDDAEGKFLRRYVDAQVLPFNPFDSIDTSGVGRLMRIATEEGRAANPQLEVGICGEHGGDPKTIAFCHALGLNYVSCSPFRVPVARLAAAQSALGQLAPN